MTRRQWPLNQAPDSRETPSSDRSEQVVVDGHQGPTEPAPDSVVASSKPISEPSPPTAAHIQLFGDRVRKPASSMPPQTTLEFKPPSSSSPLRLVAPRDALKALADAISNRTTGSLVTKAAEDSNGAAEKVERIRRIVLRDGDVVFAASEVADEALIHFLVERGDLTAEHAAMRIGRMPTAGRHAAAALIANGFLGQDDLWPVLRAHSEWIIGRALLDIPATFFLENEPPERLKAEPNVFGGAAGVEVFIETVRRILAPQEAVARLHGLDAELGVGNASALLAESALTTEEVEVIRAAAGMTVGAIVTNLQVEFAPVIYALVCLGVLSCTATSRQDRPASERPLIDPLDANAVRERIRARLALVRESDYFGILGISRTATAYEIRRAYLTLRRDFEPNRLLTAATADMSHDVDLIVEVLEEAYQILRDPHRRERYRRALEAMPG